MKCEGCGVESDGVEVVIESYEYYKTVSYGQRDKETGEYTDVETRRAAQQVPVQKCIQCRDDTVSDPFGDREGGGDLKCDRCGCTASYADAMVSDIRGGDCSHVWKEN